MATRTLPSTAAPRFNFAPFYGKVPPGVVAQFRRTHRAWWPHRRQASAVVGSLLLIVVLGAGILVILCLALAAVFLPKPTVLIVAFTALAWGVMALVVTYLIGLLRRDVRFGPGWTRMTRLDAFARLNNMDYEFQRTNVRYNGAIFSLGARGIATDILTVRTGRGIQIGNYRSFARSSFDSGRFFGGYVVIELDRRMPHMIAIAKRKRAWIGRRQSIAPGILRSQILSLEGDFDRYFTLYAPKQYERDALYVFTPDLMVLLIDRLSSFDVEIVDNRLYIYSHKPFTMLDPATHERLASIVQIVGHKATNQTLRYSDDRTAPDVDSVAPGGLRLRRGITAGAVVAVLYIVLRVVAAFHGIN